MNMNYNNLFEEVEKLEKEMEMEFENLDETKERVFGSISERHDELNEAIASLNKTVFGGPEIVELDFETKLESNIDSTLDETSKLLDDLLEDL